MPQCTQAERELLDALAERLPTVSGQGSWSVGEGEPFGGCIACGYDALGPVGRLAAALSAWQTEQQPGIERVQESQSATFERGRIRNAWGGGLWVEPGTYLVPGVERDDGNGNVIAEDTGKVVGKIDYEDGTLIRPTG